MPSAYLFDLDGTVYLGDALLPTAAQTITTLRARRKRVLFLSNNPTHSPSDYARKLTRLGLPTDTDDVINSTVVMVDYLARMRAQHQRNLRLFVVGESPLHDTLRAAEFELTDDPRTIDFVIASFDRTFVYAKLQTAFDAVRCGAKLIATNADRYCPVPHGGEPDAAAIIAAIEACANVKCEVVVGKPSIHMAHAALKKINSTQSTPIAPRDCIMIGDRLETDVMLGINAGMQTALTLTGATSRAQLAASSIHPDHVLDQLSDVLNVA